MILSPSNGESLMSTWYRKGFWICKLSLWISSDVKQQPSNFLQSAFRCVLMTVLVFFSSNITCLLVIILSTEETYHKYLYLISETKLTAFSWGLLLFVTNMLLSWLCKYRLGSFTMLNMSLSNFCLWHCQTVLLN